MDHNKIHANSNTTLVKVKLKATVFQLDHIFIQIQHLLKLNPYKLIKISIIFKIQIQHLLKLNNVQVTSGEVHVCIQIQHLLKLNFKVIFIHNQDYNSNTTLVKVK